MRFSIGQMKATLITSLLLSATAFAQSHRCPPDTICDPLRFDQYGKLSWSDEKARLDNLAERLKQIDPDFGALFFIYAGRVACVGEARARGIRSKNYLVVRGVKPAQVIWVDGGYREEPDVEIWIVPRDISTPSAYPTIDRDHVRLKNCTKRTSMHRKRA
jgi:hypothetical protein